MPVKIDPLIVEELAAMDLVIWEAKHPREDFFNEKTGKQSSREDKSWVFVWLAGPKIPNLQAAGGATLRKAVDAALQGAELSGKHVTGLRGAVLRLDSAVGLLSRTVMHDRLYIEQPGYDRSGAFGSDLDDDIPF